MPASRALAFVDAAALDAVLQRLVPDAADRGFIGRCMIGEGPIHHRGANYVLVMLLARLLASSPDRLPAPAAGARVPMRLPPHLADEVDDGHFPIDLPLGALGLLAGGDRARIDAMIDCLTDGPPQHALANVVLVSLLDRLLAAAGPATHDGAEAGPATGVEAEPDHRRGSDPSDAGT